MARSTYELLVLLGLDSNKYKKGIGEAERSTKSLGQQFDDLGGLAKAALTTGVVGGAIAAGKAIYEMGKQGAVVLQTGESFDFLLKKVGAAPDVLEQLRTETLGTVDDMTLMSSTMTLTAGASDELSKRLIENAPQLAKIAKAANKLNPLLGDTAFLYESIGTGVKRAQPLILDNLGLTIKVGDANAKMAEELGKSVEALTAEEKAMAILNATLEAGDVLIDQVGGSVDAAGDEFAILETQIKNTKDSLMKAFSPAVSDTLVVVNKLAAGLIEQQDVYEKLDAAQQEGIITLSELRGVMGAYNRGQLDVIAVTEYLTTKTREWRIENGLLSAQIHTTQDRTKEHQLQLQALATANEGAMESTVDLSSAISELAGEVADAKAANQAYEKAVKAVTKSEAEAQRMKLLLKLQTEELTAAQIENTLNNIDAINRMEELTAAFEEGRISELQFKGAISDGIVTQEEFNQVLGLTSNELDNAELRFGTVDKASSEYSNNLKTKTIPAVNELKGSMFQANAQAALLEMGLIAASGEYEARFRLFVEQVGEIKLPKELGPFPTDYILPIKVEGSGKKVEFEQFGGSVFANQPYIVGEAGPELFVPRTSGEIISNKNLKRGIGNPEIVYIRQGDSVRIEHPATAAYFAEKQHQAKFAEIDRVL